MTTTQPTENLSRYNVTWDSPSLNSAGSMPLGNGDIGVNAWVEPSGDLLLYVSKTDAWDDNGRLLKLGRIRINLSPSLVIAGRPFRQTLQLRQGVIEIVAGVTTIRLWVDANQPVIRLSIQSEAEFSAQVSLELWRTSERTLGADEISYGDGRSRPGGLTEYPDTVASHPDRIVWYHHNRHSLWPELVAIQGLSAPDPWQDRIFGATITGEGLVSGDAQRLHSVQPQTQCMISIYPLTVQGSVDSWTDALDQTIANLDSSGLGDLAQHQDWWAGFWDRSWLFIESEADNSQQAEPFQITQAYLLGRFLFACSGRGAFPIKFNGSIFTVEPHLTAQTSDLFEELGPRAAYNPDYRRWGSGYWFQNTRLPYWSMLQSGDLDLMRPLFRMYQDALPLAKARTHLYFQHEGAFFPETINAWGAYLPDVYGFDRPATLPLSEITVGQIRHHYESNLELLAMMLDYYAFGGDQAFVSDTLLPCADEILHFYDAHYERDATGKLRLSPSQALEAWWDTVNPLPDVAGMHGVLDGLLALPAEVLSPAQREGWQTLRASLPAIPTTLQDGQTLLSAAEVFNDPTPHNVENPELYAVWPFRLYASGKGNLPIGIASFHARKNIEPVGWQQSAIQAAILGLTDDAQREVTLKYRAHNPYFRFPIMWGPNYDWIPDQDNGSVANIALQAMLMQYDGQTIFLFPAWPRAWSVDFKLHAPQNTTIEGTYRSGKLHRLIVTPETRTHDVVNRLNDKDSAS